MGNKTTVTKVTMGGAVAILVVFVATKFGLSFTEVESGSIVTALTAIFNYIIPQKD